MKITHVYIGGNAIVVINGVSHTKAMSLESYNSLVLKIKRVNLTGKGEKKLLELLVSDKVISRQKAVVKTEAKKAIVTKALKRVEKSTKKKELKVKKKTNKMMQTLDAHAWFTVKEGKVYLNPYTNVSLPPIMVERFYTVLKEWTANKTEELKKEIKGLLHFWLQTLMNPNQRSRAEAFKYITRNGLTITENGYFVCFRRVLSTGKMEQSSLALQAEKIQGIVTDLVEKCKRQKKGMGTHYIIEQVGAFSMVHKAKLRSYEGTAIIHGTVKELSEQLDALPFLEEHNKMVEVFTDNHTKKMRIVLGEPVSIPRADCDANPSVSCSKGLHVGTPDFIRGGSFGNQSVVCLVSPTDVIAVPYDDAHKMRVCRYLPFAKIDNAELETFETLRLYDHSFKEYQTKELKTMLESKLSSLVDYTIALEEYTDKIETADEEEAKRIRRNLDMLEQQAEKDRKALEKAKSNSDFDTSHLNLQELTMIIKQRKILVS